VEKKGRNTDPEKPETASQGGKRHGDQKEKKEKALKTQAPLRNEGRYVERKWNVWVLTWGGKAGETRGVEKG